MSLKFLALLLAAAALTGVLLSAGSIIGLVGMELYESTPEEVYHRQTYSDRYYFSVDLVHRYASLELGGLPEEYLNEYYGDEWLYETYPEGSYFYAIYNDSGDRVCASEGMIPEEAECYEVQLGGIWYRCQVSAENVPAGKEVYSDSWYDAEADEFVDILYVKKQVTGYTVRLFLTEDAVTYDSFFALLEGLYAIRYQLFWIFGGLLLLFAAAAVCLCCTAGRKPGTGELRPGGLNRLPIDIYTAVCVVAGGMLIAAISYLLDLLDNGSLTKLMLHLLLAAAVGLSVVIVALLYAWVAQLKAPERFWIKNSLVGRIFRLLGKFLRWIGRGLRRGVRWLHSLFRLLPLVWQWLVAFALMMALPPLLLVLWIMNMDWNTGAEVFFGLLFLLSVAADIGIILYSSYCFGVLMKGVQRMSRGDLNAKVSTQYLVGCFRDFALRLNSLSEAAYIAAEKQTRSERMKTELITNVSHDIKTPLTSIINFVDLLQKPHTEAQQQEYLEVLSRQSAQMKKLIEDLMELSKANSGNIAVNLQAVDAVETVNQALGEFADKLEAAGLTPVFRQPEEPVQITADGRLVWRVLFNLLSNVVKYAMPGTRLYIDLTRAEDSVVLSLKNISRSELTVSADDLLERFVRGDASRTGEGSGLGLNIAKGLMEAQRGRLQLLLDGDLFKVTLIFPAAE